MFEFKLLVKAILCAYALIALLILPVLLVGWLVA
jgi:hypothetical protein